MAYLNELCRYDAKSNFLMDILDTVANCINFYCFLNFRIHQDKSFHCEVCNVCLDKRLEGNHKCRPDSGHDECCICLEVRFNYYFLG